MVISSKVAHWKVGSVLSYCLDPSQVLSVSVVLTPELDHLSQPKYC